MKMFVTAVVASTLMALMVGCGAGEMEPSTVPAARPMAETQERFNLYASTPLDRGQSCVVGDEGDEDGMALRPVIYLNGPASVE